MDGWNLGDGLVTYWSFSDDNIKSAAQDERKAGFFFDAIQILLLLSCCQEMSYVNPTLDFQQRRQQWNVSEPI